MPANKAWHDLFFAHRQDARDALLDRWADGEAISVEAEFNAVYREAFRFASIVLEACGEVLSAQELTEEFLRRANGA